METAQNISDYFEYNKNNPEFAPSQFFTTYTNNVQDFTSPTQKSAELPEFKVADLNISSPYVQQPLYKEAPFTNIYDTPVSSTKTSGVTNSGEKINISKGETGTAKRAIDYLVKSGLSREVATAITANLHVESGFNTSVIGDTKLGKGQEAQGIGQWRLGRKDNMKSFLRNKGLPETSFEGQLSFLVHELQSGQDGSGGEAWRKMQSTKDVGELAGIFDKYYERSDGKARNRRISLARQLYGKV